MPNRLFRWGRFPSPIITLWIVADDNDGGAKRSTDKGANFTQFGNTSYNTTVYQHSNGDIYYGNHQGLYRSQNGGSSFSTVFNESMLKIRYYDGYFYACRGNAWSMSFLGLWRSSSGDADSWVRILDARVFSAFVGTDGTIYAATADGVSKSTDDGDSWTSYTTTNGLVNNLTCNVLVDSHGTIWATSGHPQDDRGMDGGVSKSTDGGTNWTAYTTTTSGLTHGNVRGLAYDPVRDRIYVASGGDTGRGIDYTDDGGTNWSHPDPHSNHIKFSAVYYCDGTVYACGNSGGSWSDNGDDWTDINVLSTNEHRYRDIFAVTTT